MSDIDLGPGKYDVKYVLDDQSKPMTIGVRRDEKIDRMTPGPGQYDGEQAASLVYSRSQAAEFSKNASLKTLGYRIGDELPYQIDPTMGPGKYSPEKADGSTK